VPKAPLEQTSTEGAPDISHQLPNPTLRTPLNVSCYLHKRCLSECPDQPPNYRAIPNVSLHLHWKRDRKHLSRELDRSRLLPICRSYSDAGLGRTLWIFRNRPRNRYRSWMALSGLQRCAVSLDRKMAGELTFNQAEELAKTLAQMKFVLQGTQGMLLDLPNCVKLF
jgi:hypothetical protein